MPNYINAIQMPPLPVVAWLTGSGILTSNFVYKSSWIPKPVDEPLCKVSDAQAYAAQRCQELEVALREAQGELAARCAFGAANKCAAALSNQTKEQP